MRASYDARYLEVVKQMTAQGMELRMVTAVRYRTASRAASVGEHIAFMPTGLKNHLQHLGVTPLELSAHSAHQLVRAATRPSTPKNAIMAR